MNGWLEVIARRPTARLVLLALAVHHVALPLLLVARPAHAEVGALALYLDSDGTECRNTPGNPTTFFLSSTAPTDKTAKCVDSGPIDFNKGNPWAPIATWSTVPQAGVLSALDPVRAWAGLRNSDDQGTQFDVLAEAFHGSTLVASGLTRCVTGLTRNANRAREIIVPFGPVTPSVFNGTSDVFSIKLSTRVGTTPDEARCPGPGGSHLNARGLRLYYAGASVASGVGATLGAGSGPPVFESTPVVSAVTGLLYSYAPAARDPMGGQPELELVAGPSGMALLPPGVLRWIPTDGQTGPHPVHVRARNAVNATSSQEFVVTASRFNRIPTITSVPVAFARTGQDYRYQVTAYDPEQQALTFSLGPGAPAGMTIDSATGLVGWRPGTDASGAHQIVVVAADPLGGQDRQSFRLDVVDAAAALSILSPQGAYSVAPGQTLTVPLQASLADAVFGASPIPANLFVVGGNLLFTPTTAQVGTHTLSVTARLGDLHASNVITITVGASNRPPEIAPIPPQSVVEAGQLTFTVLASDPDGDQVTVTAPGLNIPGALFNTFTRQFTFNPGTGQAGPHQVTFVASDGRAAAQVDVAIQVTGRPPQQQVLGLTVEPPGNPTLLPTVTIKGSTTGNGTAVPPGASLPALITGLHPASLRQGETGVVEITGLNTQFSQGTSRAVFGDGIAVTDLTVQSATRARATIRVDTLAATGARQVQMSTPTGNVGSVVGFNVTRGTASIKGVVVDPATGQPLANAVVTVSGTTVKALTDAQGRFTLVDVPPGAVTLLVTLSNYQVLQLGVVVGTNDAVDLPDPLKVNALARPPSVGGVLPRAATVASVLDRGIASPGSTMTVEQAKAAVGDTLIAVGSDEVGVLDEQGNQLNPKMKGAGMLSLTPKGVEAHARRLLLGQSYRVADLLFALRSAYSFALRFVPDGEILLGLQRAVDTAWARPDDPSSAIILVMFSRGTVRPPQPPRITLETRLNSVQAFLFVSSVTVRFAPDLDRAITRIYQKNGLTPPEIGGLPAPGGTAVASGPGLSGRVVAALAGLLRPTEAYAVSPDETVAERRLREKSSYTAALYQLRFADAIPDLVIGAAGGALLAWGVGTVVNTITAAQGAPAATFALGRQVALAAVLGGVFAVLQKLLQMYGLATTLRSLHPDPPIGHSAALLPDGSARIVFNRSTADIQTAAEGRHSLYRNGGSTPLVTVQDGGGLDTSKFRYEYRLYRVRGIDDETGTPLDLRPLPVFDAQGRQDPERMQFFVPDRFLQDEINYFKIGTFQLYGSAAMPASEPQAYHYRDLVEIPSTIDPIVSMLLSLTFSFATPGVPGIPGPDYLAPIFLHGALQATEALIHGRAGQRAAAFADYAGLVGPNLEEDVRGARAALNSHQTQLNEARLRGQALRTQYETLLTRMSRHAGVLDVLAKNPTVVLGEGNPVTATLAQLLDQPSLPPSQAGALQGVSNLVQETSTLQTLSDAQDAYRARLMRFEEQLRGLLARSRETGQPITFADLDGIEVRGRPKFSVANNAVVDASLGADVTIHVADPPLPSQFVHEVQVTIVPPGPEPTRTLSLSELKALDLDGTAQLQEAVNAKVTQLQTVANQTRAMVSATPDEMNALTRDLAENRVAQERLAQEVEAGKVKVEAAEARRVQNAEALRRAEIEAPRPAGATPLERLRRFQTGVNVAGGILSTAGLVYFAFDTNRTLKQGAAVLPSEMSEAFILNQRRAPGTSTLRIAADPQVPPDGLLAATHPPYVPPTPGNPFPVKVGTVHALAYHDESLVLQGTVVADLGFPSDFFAVDDEGLIYANNANSNQRFGGRNWRFTRGPIDFDQPIESDPSNPIQTATGVVKEFAGSLNYYGLDAFRPPYPAEPVAMTTSDFCCDHDGRVVQMPFVADIDFSVTPPIGRVVRLPVEDRGRVHDTRLVGRAWARSEELRLETPSALVPGHQDYFDGVSPPRRPLLLSDGPRIWVLFHPGFGDPGIAAFRNKVVDTPGRRWAGLLVDDHGHLYALDAASGKIWLLPKAAVAQAMASTLGPDEFDAAAFLVSTGHVNALDLARTSDGNGYFVSNPGPLVTRERVPIVGLVPAGITLSRLEAFDGLNYRLPVTLYTSGGRQRLLILTSFQTASHLSLKLVATVAGSDQERVIDLSLPVLLGAHVLPEDALNALAGQP